MIDTVANEYLLSVSLRESETLFKLREYNSTHVKGAMQVSPEIGQFLAFLVQLTKAEKVLEIGTFTGYSSLWLVSNLLDDGRLITCDINTEYTSIARDFWKMAGVEEKIELRILPAIDMLKCLMKDCGASSFDFIFIDADKTNYINYYEMALSLVKPGGLIAIDNVLRAAKFIGNGKPLSENAKAIHNLNEKIHCDSRVDLAMLPIAEGLTVLIKK